VFSPRILGLGWGAGDDPLDYTERN